MLSFGPPQARTYVGTIQKRAITTESALDRQPSTSLNFTTIKIFAPLLFLDDSSNSPSFPP